jgi:hypothetical protein
MDVVIAAVLHELRSVRWTLYVCSGNDPVEQALVAVLAGPEGSG